jgi:hypothetical protein
MAGYAVAAVAAGGMAAAAAAAKKKRDSAAVVVLYNRIVDLPDPSELTLETVKVGCTACGV